ncbi:hypothetical protein ATCC90586_000805 [Pythium insidiosum]|nr:hypothetical protein ATCC90586_000805 [Pythium insidiosum]
MTERAATHPARSPSSEMREVDGGGSSDGSSPVDRSDAESEARTSPAAHSIGVKRRKSTYEARKEEKALLLEELEKLRVRVQELECQSQLSWPTKSATELQRAVAENALLNRGVKESEYRVAGVQSMVSGLLMTSTRSPLETYIHLPIDRAERKRILESMRMGKLKEALGFAQERSRFLDLSRRHQSVESFDSPDGALVEIKLHAAVVEGVSSVRTVFDAMLHFFSHQEISISEALGVVTVREDDDIDHETSSVSQHRLVTSVSHGQAFVDIESNIAVFSEFVEATDEHGYPFGIITADAIDQDDLYPYRPLERARFEISAFALITAIPHSE